MSEELMMAAIIVLIKEANGNYWWKETISWSVARVQYYTDHYSHGQVLWCVASLFPFPCDL